MRKPVHLNVPLKSPEDIVPHLGKGPAHWRDGYSAKELARHWCGWNSLPPDIGAVLQSEPLFRGAELVDAIFERDTSLGDRYRPSQTDLLCILGLTDPPGGLAVMGVEAKVSEPFGRCLSDEYFPSPRSAKQQRIERLATMFGLDVRNSSFLDLRYQLLHRTAAALFEAKRYRADKAIMMVQTFSASNEHWEDYARFVEALGGKPEKGALCAIKLDGEPDLWLGWCNSANFKPGPPPWVQGQN